jgi:hypothetical protein
MDLQLAQESQDALELIISVVVPAVALLLGFAITVLAGAGAWASVQRVVQMFRPHVDEADDWLILTLDGIGEAVLHRELDEAYISKLLTALVDAIGKPPQEVVVGDAPK